MVIDCAIDHGWRDPGELTAYMPEAWRDYIGTPGTLPGGAGARPLLLNSAYAQPEPAAGATWPTTLAPAVAERERLERSWLDPNGVEVAILTHGTMRAAACCVNPQLAEVLVRAANDWTIERWLEPDVSGRLRGTLLVPEQVPEAAAAEVRRLGGHPRIAAVLVTGAGPGKPAGHPIWDPLYEAAVEFDLPVMIHTGGDAVQDNATLPTAGGPPSTFAELTALSAQGLMTHLVSLIGQATFERHPRLRVVLAGGGFSWLPSILWRFDTNHYSLRVEAPWVKRMPSEYMRDHVRVVASPFDGPPTGLAAERVARAFDAFAAFADLVCFGSGYPGRRAKRPSEVLERVPAAWEKALAAGNARAFFRLG